MLFFLSSPVCYSCLTLFPLADSHLPPMQQKESPNKFPSRIQDKTGTELDNIPVLRYLEPARRGDTGDVVYSLPAVLTTIKAPSHFQDFPALDKEKENYGDWSETCLDALTLTGIRKYVEGRIPQPTDTAQLEIWKDNDALAINSESTRVMFIIPEQL
ncbi:hypothetical protein B0H14DRAFT_2561836 [Mycena olivaceomarginata]|nr:hypothetical protein B0H14DRAFT_2578622 [Mycena olivaceomarginata]KAJ7889337.1 hypothetical protein B0H14DRAFT_2561836 [Mycena olivaceomarginata]